MLHSFIIGLITPQNICRVPQPMKSWKIRHIDIINVSGGIYQNMYQVVLKRCGGIAKHNILEAVHEHTRSHLRKHHTNSPTNAKLRVIPHTCCILHVYLEKDYTSKCTYQKLWRQSAGHQGFRGKHHTRCWTYSHYCQIADMKP